MTKNPSHQSQLSNFDLVSSRRCSELWPPSLIRRPELGLGEGLALGRLGGWIRLRGIVASDCWPAASGPCPVASSGGQAGSGPHPLVSVTCSTRLGSGDARQGKARQASPESYRKGWAWENVANDSTSGSTGVELTAARLCETSPAAGTRDLGDRAGREFIDGTNEPGILHKQRGLQNCDADVEARRHWTEH
jgi:hypothetical protein